MFFLVIRNLISKVFLVNFTLAASCVYGQQLAESCVEKGKIYRSLGSLRLNFVKVDSAFFLPGMIKLSKALPDKWIQYGAEMDSLEIRVIDFSSVDDRKFSFQFATIHRHILYPTYPKKSHVKLPCSIEVFFEVGLGRIYGYVSLELKIRRHRFKSVYGYWEWSKSTNRIEFTKQGAKTPTLYWDLK